MPADFQQAYAEPYFLFIFKKNFSDAYDTHQKHIRYPWYHWRPYR